MKKEIRNGNVAILISHGYGAGWSTWNENKDCLFSPEIVALVEAKKHSEITDELCGALFGEGFYSGGSVGLEVHWLPQGTAFEVDEYDGYESLKTYDNLILTA